MGMGENGNNRSGHGGCECVLMYEPLAAMFTFSNYSIVQNELSCNQQCEHMCAVNKHKLQ
jgi:hypothetical protein